MYMYALSWRQQFSLITSPSFSLDAHFIFSTPPCSTMFLALLACFKQISVLVLAEKVVTENNESIHLYMTIIINTYNYKLRKNQNMVLSKDALSSPPPSCRQPDPALFIFIFSSYVQAMYVCMFVPCCP